MDIEKRKARQRRYYLRNKEYIKQRERKKYQVNRISIRLRRAALVTPEYKVKAAEREREKYNKNRNTVLSHYGSKCVCCGETEPLFLEIDHKFNDGKAHRKEIGVSARSLLNWIIKNDFPNNVQILCSNCNQGKKRNGGICPHKTKNQ